MDANRRVKITGLGALSTLGDSPTAIHQALCSGRHGRSPLKRFEMPDLPHFEAGELDFDARTYLPSGNLRPLDRTGRLAASAAQLALDDSGWTRELRDDYPVGLALGTMYGSVHTIAAFDQRALEAGPQYVKPFDFANSVINAAAGQTAIWHHLWGLNSTLTGGPCASAQALAYAADLIASGRAEAVLAGGADELCFESLFSASQAGLLADPAADAVPFDGQRGGLNLSEGAALLMLESAEGAMQRGAKVYGEVLGHASGFDPRRGEDSALAIEVLARCVRRALDASGLEPSQVRAVSASGSGSDRGDRHEAKVLAEVFSDEGVPPVSAVKGGLGECLGASTALQAVVALEGMAQKTQPGVVGLRSVDKALPLTGLSSNAIQGVEPGPMLLVAVGLDGNVCALVLGPAAT